MSRLTKVCDKRGKVAITVDHGVIAHRIDFVLTFLVDKITMPVPKIAGSITAVTDAVQARRVACIGTTNRCNNFALWPVELKP